MATEQSVNLFALVQNAIVSETEHARKEQQLRQQLRQQRQQQLFQQSIKRLENELPVLIKQAIRLGKSSVELPGFCVNCYVFLARDFIMPSLWQDVKKFCESQGLLLVLKQQSFIDPFNPKRTKYRYSLNIDLTNYEIDSA
jgi:hypothetical protein